MIKTTLTILAASVALVLAGCATQAQTGALVGGIIGTAVGGPIGGTAAAHIVGGAVGFVVGAIIIGGNIGKHMDEQDQKMAAKAVQTNSIQTWMNADTETTYVVTPKDHGNGTSTVKTDMTKDNKTTTETTIVKKIRE